MAPDAMSRRDFVKAAGVGAVALSALPAAGQDAPARAPVMMREEDEPIAALVKKHTGHEPTSVEELKWYQIYGDSDSTSYSVRCGEREYVVRVPARARAWAMGSLGLDADYHAVIGEYVCDALRERGLGAPIVYAVDRDCDIMDRPCSVASRIPGRPWRAYEDDGPEQRVAPATGQEVGRFVRGLHEIAPREGFGPVTDEGVGLMGSSSDLVWVLQQSRAEGARRRGAISDDEFKLTTKIIDRWAPQCDMDEGRILWMDDIMFGVLVDAQKRTATGVSHAVEAWSGDPDYELEWFAYYAEDTDAPIAPPDEFAEGYGRPYDEKCDKRSFYRMCCYLCKFAWLNMKTERAAHHRERFREIIERLA